MEQNNNQIELKSTEEDNFKMRRSFSWDRAFFTSDGFLDADELSNMIEGSSDDVDHQLQKIEEIETLEAKLFDEMEASTRKDTETSKASSSRTNLSSGKRDSQAKKVKPSLSTAPLSSSTPIKTAQATRSSPSSGGSPGNRAKSPARRSTSSKTSKVASDSPSKTSAGITTKNRMARVNTRVSRTAPSSPGSSGSSSSSSAAAAFSVNQRTKRSNSVPRRSTVNREKPSAVNARRNDENRISKPAVSLIPKTQSSISLKVKPPPVISHPSSSLRSYNSSSSSTAQGPSESSSSTSSCLADQKSKSMGKKGSTVHQRSKSTLKNRPTGQSGKQPAASRSETGSPNASKTRNRISPKSVTAVSTGLKPVSQKIATPKPSKKQSSAKAKPSSSISRDVENIIVVSNPEVLDIKGKLNALKMEISMQKKDRCKENKISHGESGKGESSSFIQMNNKTKSK